MAAVAGGGGDSCHCLGVREQGRGSRGLVLDAMRGRGVEREKERRVRALPPEELKGQISKGVGLVLTRLRGERAIFVECVVLVPVRGVADQRIPFVPSRRAVVGGKSLRHAVPVQELAHQGGLIARLLQPERQVSILQPVAHERIERALSSVWMATMLGGGCAGVGASPPVPVFEANGSVANASPARRATKAARETRTTFPRPCIAALSPRVGLGTARSGVRGRNRPSPDAMGDPGLEPGTSSLSERRSDRLS